MVDLYKEIKASVSWITVGHDIAYSAERLSECILNTSVMTYISLHSSISAVAMPCGWSALPSKLSALHITSPNGLLSGNECLTFIEKGNWMSILLPNPSFSSLFPSFLLSFLLFSLTPPSHLSLSPSSLTPFSPLFSLLPCKSTLLSPPSRPVGIFPGLWKECRGQYQGIQPSPEWVQVLQEVHHGSSI